MIKKIVITGDEKLHLKQFVEKLTVAGIAFEEASRLLKLKSENMWNEIRRMYPEVPEETRLNPTVNYPKDGEWSITYFKED